MTLALAACFGGAPLTQALSPAGASADGSSGPSGATGTSVCPTSNPPNELTLAGGTPQTAQLEATFAGPLLVMLANTNGCPVTGVLSSPITFTAPAGGASAAFKASGSDTLTVGADAQGAAQSGALTANDTPGSYAVTATSAYGTVSFALTNTAAGIPARIIRQAPISQSALVRTGYADPLAVRVVDVNGTPVAGSVVTFTLGGSGPAAAGASFSGGSTRATETTNSNGVATSPRFGANSTSGNLTATAAVAHVTEPASFRLRNLGAHALRLRRLGPGQRQATVGGRYKRPLQARVTDAAGTPVAGASVTFTLGSAAVGNAAAGAQFTTGTSQATTTTGRHGVATSPPIAADNTAGTVTAIATLQGSTRGARLLLHNVAGAPAKISAGVAANEQTTTGTSFPIPLAVTVTDAHNNPVPHVPVTFTAPHTGATGSFDGRHRITIRTNMRGIAVAPRYTANEVAGGYIVTATTPGVRAAAFALVNRLP